MGESNRPAINRRARARLSVELDKLQGTWHVDSLIMDGQRMEMNRVAGAKIIIEGKRFTSIGMGATYEGSLELDSRKTPMRVDMVFEAGHAAGTRNIGIYKLNARRWTICLATRGGKRPSTFASRPDTGLALETLTREAVVPRATTTRTEPKMPADARKQPSDRETGADGGPPTELEGEWAMITAVINGAPLGDDLVKWCTRVTRGHITSVIAGPQVMLNARFALDASTKPGHIDYTNVAGTHKGKLQLGIFDVSGDTLRICMAAPGQPRPAEFLSKPRDGRSYTTWRLIKR